MLFCPIPFIECCEGRLTNLLGDLAVHRLDIVIADCPVLDNLNVRRYDHFLGESGVSVFAAQLLFDKAIGEFPNMLDAQPFLLPESEVALHARLSRWFEAERPRIIGEFDDSAPT